VNVSKQFKDEYKVYRTGVGLATLAVFKKSDTTRPLDGQVVDDNEEGVLREAFAQCKDSIATGRNIKNLNSILDDTTHCPARFNLKKNLPATVSTSIHMSTDSQSIPV
jgi:hypothetical protein